MSVKVKVTTNYQGYIVLSCVFKGYLVERKYMYYTKKEALEQFKIELMSL